MSTDPSDREARIDGLCADYLARAEVGAPPEREAWLAGHADVAAELGEFLDCLGEVGRRVSPLRAAAGCDDTIDHRSETAASGDTPVAPLGYEILGQIAEGGMGVVYRAREVQLNRVVALKMIRADVISGESAVQRFRLEAEAAAGFDHPHIVPVYEVGVTEGGHPFFSMKLVQGRTLSDWIEEGWSPGGTLGTAAGLRKGVSLLSAVARAVHYAHQRGFLHRDLKPANVLLDSADLPYVTDFGLAKRLVDGSHAGSLTRDGGLVGTLGYMAPEQARGEKRLTTATDVYALGAILFHVLTGRSLRPGRTLAEVSSHIGKEPPPPRSLNPRADRDLEAICLKCLANEPATRFGSAEALADDLDRWCQGRPTQTRPPGSVRRLWLWARRRPEVAALSSLTLVVFLAGVGLVAWKWQAEIDARKRETAAKREIQAQASRSAAIVAQGLLESGTDGDPENLGDAMLWWARSLRLAPEGYARERSAARVNLAALAGHVHTLLEQWQRSVPTSQLILSPDGLHAAVAHGDTVRVLDPRTGLTFGSPLAHPGVGIVSFSPDGTTLATAGDQVVRVWDLRTSTPVRVRELELKNKVMTVALGPAGRLVAVAVAPDPDLDISSVLLFENGMSIGDPIKNLGGVRALVFDNSGSLLATGSADKSAQVWDARTGKPIGPSLPHDDSVRAVVFSPNGSKLITGCDDHLARVWSLGTVGPSLKLEHQDHVRSVAFSPDGRLVATGGNDSVVQVWETATGRRVGQRLRHGGGVHTVGFAAGGSELITSSADGTVRVLKLSAGAREDRTVTLGTAVNTVTIPSEGSDLYVGTRNGLLRLDKATLKWRDENPLLALAGGMALTSLPEVWTVACSPRVEWVASGGRTAGSGGWLRVSRADGTMTRTFSLKQPVRALSFSPDGTRLLVSAADSKTGEALIWNPAAPEAAPRAFISREPVWAVAFSPDGGRYAASTGYGTVRVWGSDQPDGPSRTFSHPWRVVALAFDRDGNRLVTASTDRVVRVWDAATGEILTESSEHNGAVWAVAVSPDGRLIASAGRDRCVRVWDAETGASVGAPVHHRAVVWAVTFSPDGKEIWSGSEDGTVRGGEGGTVRSSRTPDTMLDVPDVSVETWAEVLTGACLDGDRVRVLAPAEWLERRDRLNAAGVAR